MRVIIVDDSALVRDGLTSLLVDEGVDVIATFPDASGVVEAVEQYQPDVLIIDVRMPPSFQTEGLEVALQARRNTPATSILVLSQHIETRYAVELLEEGAAGVGYLLKDRVTEIDSFLDAPPPGGGRWQCHRPRSRDQARSPPPKPRNTRPSHRTGAGSAIAHGPRSLQRGDRRTPLRQPTYRGNARQQHPQQTRPPTRRRHRPTSQRSHHVAPNNNTPLKPPATSDHMRGIRRLSRRRTRYVKAACVHVPGFPWLHPQKSPHWYR